MGKTTSLSYQITSAVDSCTTSGESKRDYKQKHGGDTDWHVFGFEYKNELCQTGKDLGRFLHENYPDLKYIRDTTPEMVQKFVDHKSETCNNKTLEKIYSNLHKLDKIIEHKYKDSIGTRYVSVPESKTGKEDIKTKIIGDADYKRLLESVGEDSPAGRSLKLSHSCGLRLEETVCVKMDRFEPTGGRWGFGTLNILAGDGSKGNRPRIIDIPSSDARREVLEAVEGRQPGQLIVAKADGSQYEKKSITRTISRHMDKLEIGSEYKQNKNHSLRKAFAQACYDLCREKGMSKKDSLGYVNRQLGHSENRSDLSAVYVKYQW